MLFPTSEMKNGLNHILLVETFNVVVVYPELVPEIVW